MKKSFYYNPSFQNWSQIIVDANNELLYKNEGISSNFFIPEFAISTKNQFEELKEKWINETKFLSNPGLIYENDNYKKIIELDWAVIPYLLNDLSKNNNDWIFALREITSENPIREGHNGYFNLMKDDWLNWGKNYENEYAYYDFRYAS